MIVHYLGDMKKWFTKQSLDIIQIGIMPRIKLLERRRNRMRRENMKKM